MLADALNRDSQLYYLITLFPDDFIHPLFVLVNCLEVTKYPQYPSRFIFNFTTQSDHLFADLFLLTQAISITNCQVLDIMCLITHQLCNFTIFLFKCGEIQGILLLQLIDLLTARLKAFKQQLCHPWFRLFTKWCFLMKYLLFIQ